MRRWLSESPKKRREVVAAAALMLALVLIAGSLANTARRTPLDFATRYAAGVATARGEDPYDTHVLSPIERKLVGFRFSLCAITLVVVALPVIWAFTGWL